MSDRRKKIGLPGGSLVYLGEDKNTLTPIDITVIDYSENHLEEFCVTKIEDLAQFNNTNSITWINIDGIHDVNFIKSIGEIFDLHSLLLEDILNSEHRPKIEEYENNIHFTLKQLDWDTHKKVIVDEQISLIIGHGFVISFQEKKGDIFEPIRERLRNSKGRIRKLKSDYLAYTLIDVTVDHYFVIIEQIEEQIEKLELKILKETEEEHIRLIQILKKDLLFLRKSIIPLREAIGNLEKIGTEFVEEKTTYFLKDVYDHTVHITEEIESYREMLNTLMELHLSGMNDRLNKVMKVLTVISTIFIPLTFIVGVYGMNFKVMPELEWQYGYLSVWILMIGIVFFMIYILKRNKWM